MGLGGYFKQNRSRYTMAGFVLLFLFLIVISLFTSILSSGKEQEKLPEFQVDRSIYNAKGSGYQAWYQTIRQANKTSENNKSVSVKVWRAPFEQLGQIGAPANAPATMLILEPKYLNSPRESPINQADLDALLEWVRQGNTLIFLDKINRPHTRQLLARLQFKQHQQKPPPLPKPITIQKATDSKASANEANSKNAPKKQGASVNVFAEQPIIFQQDNSETPTLNAHLSQNAFVAPIYPGQYALSQYEAKKQSSSYIMLKTSQTPVLLKSEFGRGDIILGSVSDLAQNRYLKETLWDNYQLFTNLVFSPGKPLYINEFVHAKKDINSNFWAYIYNRTPVGKTGVQLGVLFLFLMWWSYSNWRPRLLPALEADAPVSLNSFIASLAGLYHRAEADNLALKPCFDSVFSALERRCRIGLSITMSDNEIEHRLKRALMGSHGFLAYLGYAEAEAQNTVTMLKTVYSILYRPENNPPDQYSEHAFLRWIQQLSQLRNRLIRD
ncbi:MAG: DUF4350 domain-containing protein [Vampirovibrionales bacterium]|nr:DUF4350 domain-containing protein [Vampirovibrionales bacterium]